MKYIEFESAFGKKYKGYLNQSTYCANGNLALSVMVTNEDGEEEPWAFLTTNVIDFPAGAPLVLVDVNNLGDSTIVDVLTKAGFFKATGIEIPSGYCKYPVYEIIGNLDEWCS